MILLYLQQIQFKEVLLENMDISKALIESVSTHSIELLVLGAASRGGLVKYVINYSKNGTCIYGIWDIIPTHITFIIELSVDFT